MAQLSNGKYNQSALRRGWNCQSCNFYNFDRNSACLTCGVPRPSHSTVPPLLAQQFVPNWATSGNAASANFAPSHVVTRSLRGGPRIKKREKNTNSGRRVIEGRVDKTEHKGKGTIGPKAMSEMAVLYAAAGCVVPPEMADIAHAEMILQRRVAAAEAAEAEKKRELNEAMELTAKLKELLRVKPIPGTLVAALVASAIAEEQIDEEQMYGEEQMDTAETTEGVKHLTLDSFV